MNTTLDTTCAICHLPFTARRPVETNETGVAVHSVCQAEQTAIQIRETAGRDAFWGGLPRLAAYLLDTHGYEMDGQHYPANGATLAEFIAWTAELIDADFNYYAR